MQRVQTSQFKSALVDRRIPLPLRYSIVPTSLDSAAQRGPVRRKPARLLRAVKTEHRQIAGIQHRILADGHTARGGETGLGAFYEAQEEAARRIAHRLHDESAQMLATVYLQLATIARDCPVLTVQKIDLVVKQLDEVREQLRGLSHELSPPILEQHGLMPALQSLAKGVRHRSGLKIVVCGNISNLPRLVAAVLYRVVQEALSNVVRHAKATEALVRLSVESNRVFCTVSDDGIGFKTPEHHQDVVIASTYGSAQGSMPDPDHGRVYSPVNGLGLAGIHERVTALKGHCRFAPCQNGGMELTVEIPL